MPTGVYVRSEEHRGKLSEVQKGRIKSPRERTNISASKKSERNPNWKGDDASPFQKHQWPQRHYPKTGVCEECGAEGKTHYAFLRHPEPHTRNRDDYRELRPSCHWTFDIASGHRPSLNGNRKEHHMARSEKVPVRHGSEESAELFPGRDTDVSFDKSDPVNDRAWEGTGEKYTPKEPVSNLSMEAINQRAAPKK
jgi:hypothetical protein